MNTVIQIAEPERIYAALGLCPARMHDCRCAGSAASHEETKLHHCSAPGCGALWTTAGRVIRLPMSRRAPLWVVTTS